MEAVALNRISKPPGTDVWSKTMPLVQLGPATAVLPTMHIAAAAANLITALKDIGDSMFG